MQPFKIEAIARAAATTADIYWNSPLESKVRNTAEETTFKLLAKIEELLEEKEDD